MRAYRPVPRADMKRTEDCSIVPVHERVVLKLMGIDRLQR
jgi:hypothetical protein